MINGWLAGAAGTLFLVALVHSVLGEALVFRRIRGAAWLQADGGRRLGRGHIGILWASWHGLTAMGWGVAAVFGWLSCLPAEVRVPLAFIDGALACALAATGVLVFVGTRGRHPGWAGLLAAALLAWMGRGA